MLNLPMNEPLQNLMPALDGDAWLVVETRDALMCDFSRLWLGEEPAVRLAAKGRPSCFGKWKGRLEGILSGEVYDFQIDYLAENVEDELVSIHAMLTWSDQEGRWLSRDYVDGIQNLPMGWRQLRKQMDAPKGAACLTVELALRWTEKGSVIWRRPVFRKVQNIRKGHDCPGSQDLLKDHQTLANRTSMDKGHSKCVKVASTFLKGRRNLDGNLQAMLAILDRAAAASPDLIVFSETFYDRGIYSPQTIPGPLTQVIAEKAKALSSYIVLCLNEKDGDLFYNTAVLINRLGEIVGTYRKTHLPLIEAEEGVTPGDELPVFETDFGKIGILICWDQCFPDAARILRLQGAEMIVISTIGDAPVQSRARAADNGIPVVVAGDDGPRPSRIINPLGEIISDVDNTQDAICLAEVDLGEPCYVHWMSVGDAKGEPRSLYMKERRTDLYRKYQASIDGSFQR